MEFDMEDYIIIITISYKRRIDLNFCCMVKSIILNFERENLLSSCAMFTFLFKVLHYKYCLRPALPSNIDCETLFLVNILFNSFLIISFLAFANLNSNDQKVNQENLIAFHWY